MTELNLHEKCPLCGSTDIRKKFKKASFTLDRCDNCTILFVKNILTKEEINRVYEEEEAQKKLSERSLPQARPGHL